jgi:hypothetical protein
MALGKAGSSLTAELNRLAGITDITKFLDEQGAANVYAETTGLATVGALNVLAGKTTPADYKDIDGICNELAGTTGLAAPAALRSIDA